MKIAEFKKPKKLELGYIKSHKKLLEYINSSPDPTKILAKVIDQSLLRPDASGEDIKKLCQEAKKYGFFSVCVNPCWVKLCVNELKNTDVKVCTVCGFPFGANSTRAKIEEAKIAYQDGADEIDMVINIGALKSGELSLISEEITQIKEATECILKVIIETCYLTDREKEVACRIAKEAGADYVKTSTGFATGGARVEDVKLMRKVVGDDMGVKASGGIRDFETCLKMIEAGATRIGTSAGVKIVT